MSRITISESTPAISERDKARFRVLIEPEHRWRTIEAGPPETLGVVLDMEVHDCSKRHMYFSPKKGTWGIRPKEPCGARTCPQCVVGYLISRVAPAWVYWHGSADVTMLARSARRPDHLKVTGPPGVLSIPHGDGRMVFTTGKTLMGGVLDAELVRAVRAVVLETRPPREKKERSETFSDIPARFDAGWLLMLAGEAGITAHINRHGLIRADGEVTSEQNRRFLDLLWGRRRPTPPPPQPERVDWSMLERLDEPVPTEGEPSLLAMGASLLDVGAGEEDPLLLAVGASTKRRRNGSSRRSRDVPATVGPRCSLCEKGGVFPHVRGLWRRYSKQMMRAHYPYTCGVGDELIAENGYVYPYEYVERLRADGEEMAIE